MTIDHGIQLKNIYMSRQQEPLFGRGSRPDSDLRFEIFIAEGGFLYEQEECRDLMAFINLSAGSTQFCGKPALLNALNNVRASSLDLSLELAGQAVDGYLRCFRPSSLFAVIVLPEHNVENRAKVQEVVSALVEQMAHPVIMLVAIGVNVTNWSGLSGLRHFVEATPETLELDSVDLFKMIAANMAPVAGLDFDLGDMLSCLGTCDAPARIAHGRWHRDVLELEFSSKRDLNLVGQATDIFTEIFADQIYLKSAAALRKAWHRNAAETSMVHFSFTSGFFNSVGPTDSGCDPVVAICLSRA